MNKNFTQLAFTPSVKKVQQKNGSRDAYARMEQSGDRFLLTENETDYISGIDHFFMSTVGENGWPYVQFRGGPKGFLKVLGEQTLGFADYTGNRQYISVGNIQSGSKVALILLDFAKRVRLKIWATASVVDAVDDPDLALRLTDSSYGAKVERLITLTVEAYDWNCPKYITPRFTKEEIMASPELAQIFE